MDGAIKLRRTTEAFSNVSTSWNSFLFHLLFHFARKSKLNFESIQLAQLSLFILINIRINNTVKCFNHINTSKVAATNLPRSVKANWHSIYCSLLLGVCFVQTGLAAEQGCYCHSSSVLWLTGCMLCATELAAERQAQRLSTVSAAHHCHH